MFTPDKSTKLFQLITKFAHSRNIQLPDLDPNPEQQEVYERFLRTFGLDQKQVDRVIDLSILPAENQTQVHATILGAIARPDDLEDGELRAILTFAASMLGGQTATGLLRRISIPIINVATRDYKFDRPYSIGVFPLRWYNAQVNIFDNTPLFLIASGCFDLIEIFVILFMASIKNPDYAITHTRRVIEHYIEIGGVRNDDFSLGRGLVDFGSTFHSRLATAAEQFAIGHEVGHAVLGHLDTSARGALPMSQGAKLESQNVEVIKPAHFEEYCADVWGFLTALKCDDAHPDKYSVPVSCAGASIFLGIAMLVECVARLKNMQCEDSHPPALGRLYFIELLHEITGNRDNSKIAWRIREFVESVGKIYPGFEMPAILDPHLNRDAVKVFEHLNVDLSEAKYVTDFQ